MSNTTRSYKGKEYQDYQEKLRHRSKPSSKKFFGFTSGEHSMQNVKLVVDDKNGNTIMNTLSIDERPQSYPVKGVDFVKYGWPFESRNKKLLIDRLREREDYNDINENTHE